MNESYDGIVGRVLRPLAAALDRAAFVLRRWIGPAEYRGIDHPAGELRLELRRDGTFRLRLAVWDPVVGAVAGHRELLGRWSRRDDQLELLARTRRLEYRALAGGELVWQRSSLPTFADGIALRRSGSREGA